MFYKVRSEDEESCKVVIYGAGDDGILTFITLLNAGIYVSAFCDRDIHKRRVKIMNKRVMSPAELSKLSTKEHMAVYIGSRKFKEEIKKSLQEMGVEEIYENSGGLQSKIIIGNVYRYGSKSWYTIIEQAYKKHIFIFGVSKLDLEFAEKLRMTDITVEAFIIDDMCNKNDVGYSVISVSELGGLYSKEKIMVYILEHIPERVRLLESHGYQNGYHYRMAPYIYGGHRIKNPYVRLDTNVGFSYVDSEKTPGYSVIGSESDYEYVIMVLGASETDEKFQYFPSWVSYYEDCFEKHGIKVKIFNGGGQAYSTQQNLIRLIRDLPLISPDLVVDYEGVISAMNLVQDGRLFRIDQPFCNDYTEKALAGLERPPRRVYIRDELLHELYGIEENTEICAGMLRDETEDKALATAEDYLYAVKCMYAVCMSEGLKFLNFFGPIMAYSEYLGEMDTEKLYHDEEFYKIVQKQEAVHRFRREVIKKMDDRFQTDLTRILIGDSMYEDVWHPNEKGNQIIAKYVYEKTMQILKDS